MQLTQVFSALNDPTRLQVFSVLATAQQPLAVAELVDILQRPQYAISKALRLLCLSGLVTEERQGQLVFSSISQQSSIQSLATWILEQAPLSEVEQSRLQWRLSLRKNNKVILCYQDTPALLRKRPRILFVCVHNSARSQLAEEYLRHELGEAVEVENAGLQPGKLNPYVVRHLAREGIDIKHKQTRSIFDVWAKGRTYDWVITVCDPEAERDCPAFPLPVHRLSWPFPDPSQFEGSPKAIAHQIKKLAAQIKANVSEFAHQIQKKETA